MNVFILAGGKGTRFREETSSKPKPMIEINGTPMVIHIINHYRYHGIRDFTILAGTKIEYINDYFKKSYEVIDNNKYKYKDSVIFVLDTGSETMTGGRVKIGVETLGLKEFMLTYGDGISDVNITELIKFYSKNNFNTVVTAARPPARFGRLKLDGNKVIEFGEKNQLDEGLINIGFFISNSNLLSYIDGKQTIFEREPLESLTVAGELGAFIHKGFWQPVDTIREKEILEDQLNKKALDWQ